MTIQEAEKILGISSEEEERKIKIRFRSLIAKYHPDAIQSEEPEHIKRAQLINEAYRVIRKQITVKKKKKNENIHWKAQIKKEAFVERTIFMSNAFGEEHESGYYPVAKGRYQWDPDLEEFHCFLHSILQTSLELLEQAEERIQIYNELSGDIKEIRFPFQIQLFHLLAGQYVSPLSALRKIAEPAYQDEEKDIYCFDAFLGTTGDSEIFRVMKGLTKEESIFVSSLQNNRIMFSDGKNRSLGYLSFADDELYYIVVPILQKHLAQVKCIVQEVQVCRKKSPYQVKVQIQLYLRMEHNLKDIDATDTNLKIASVLNEYDKILVANSYR